MEQKVDTYEPTRSIMTRDELAQHHVKNTGRDYRLSDDGYGDMEVASRSGWKALSGWGADGWDLGDWPFVVISVRNLIHVFGLDRESGQFYPYSSERLEQLRTDDRDFFEVVYELRQTVEGDTDVYRFDTREDREAAIDYLFVWYGLGREYDEWCTAGLTHDKREALGAGTLRVPVRFRGQYRH